jgi:hypothetical protein
MQFPWYSDSVRSRLTSFVQTLVNQQAAHAVVPPDQPASGYWFGGGNVIQDTDGSLLLIGRYRSGGDSRTGIQAGTRGRELTLLRSTDGGQTFARCVSWDKVALSSVDGNVLSIEGACLTKEQGEYRLYVSTEKNIPYPDGLHDYQKPGAGLWTIDVLRVNSLDSLATASIEPLLSSTDPSHLHLKDPFVWNDSTESSTAADKRFKLGFCSHPFGWSSSNTGYAELDSTGSRANRVMQGVLTRGTTWDVAMTRVTCVLPVPKVGMFAERDYTLVFYCGGECVRQLDEHSTAVRRPRGYSCEELGGVAVYVDHEISTVVRLSELEPLFVSPWGTGCSRYVDVLPTDDTFVTTWQQSQSDQSQPLVLNAVERNETEALLK